MSVFKMFKDSVKEVHTVFCTSEYLFLGNDSIEVQDDEQTVSNYSPHPDLTSLSDPN